MANKITFQRSKLSEFGDLQHQVSDNLCKFLESGKDFTVSFDYAKQPKSSAQCAAIHHLCSLLAIRFSKAYKSEINIDGAKLIVKNMFGYTRAATLEECIHEACEEKVRRSMVGQNMKSNEFRDYIELCRKKLKRPKSFADATKDEMMKLVKDIEEFGKKMGWIEIKLESEQMKALFEFYNNK